MVAQYIYDAWGNHKVLDGNGKADSNSDSIGHLNPFRYRGYFFDVETLLYYCNSRYYDPKTGRFISPDDISYLDPETIGGLNLYAYCQNNPAMYADPTGYFWDTVFDILSIGFDILCLCKNKGWKDWKNWVALGLDIIFAIIPFIPSIMGRTLDVADAAYTVSKFDDVYDSIVIGNNMGRVTNMAMVTGSLVYKGYEALNI